MNSATLRNPVLSSPEFPKSFNYDDLSCETHVESKVSMDSASFHSRSHAVRECESVEVKQLIPSSLETQNVISPGQERSIANYCEHLSCDQFRSEETPRSARNFTEDVSFRNPIVQCSANLHFVANECILSTPPITPSIESRKLNKVNESGSETFTTTYTQGNVQYVEFSHESKAETPIEEAEAIAVDQRSFCPTAEELNFFRSAMEQMRSSAEPKIKGAPRSVSTRNRKPVQHESDKNLEAALPGEAYEVRPSRASSSIPESFLIKEEEVLRRRFRSKGLQLILKEEMSAVNKKIDVRLKARSGFTRTKLLKTLNDVTSLPNHIIEVLKVRSNGEGTIRASSAIFGQPVTLHLMVKVRQGVKLNEKLVVRFYKEHLDGVDGQTQVYLVQVNAGGKWRDDDDIKLLISDIFSPFSVKSRDISMRDDSSVYSVTNRNTFGPSIVIDIPRLLIALKESGYEEVKALSVTGGLSFELKDPRCKPQIQKTGTIYLPFCAEPRQARLAILKILLEHSDVISQVDVDTKVVSKKRRVEVTEHSGLSESKDASAKEAFGAVGANGLDAESGRLSSGDTCPSSDAEGLGVPLSGCSQLSICPKQCDGDQRESESLLEPEAGEAKGSTDQPLGAESFRKHFRDQKSKEPEVFEGPLKRAKAGRPCNPRKQQPMLGPAQPQVSEAIVLSHERVDERPNFPYSKRQRVPKRDAGDMIGGMDVLLPRARRAGAVHAARSYSVQVVSKDEAEICGSVSSLSAGVHIAAFEDEENSSSKVASIKMEEEVPTFMNGAAEDIPYRTGDSDGRCLDGEYRSNRVLREERVETEMHRGSSDEGEAKDQHHTLEQTFSGSPTKDSDSRTVLCETEPSLLVAASNKVEGDLPIREAHTFAAEYCSSVPASNSPDRSVTFSTQSQTAGSSSSGLSASDLECRVRSVSGVKESCYASSLFVSSRLSAGSDGTQCYAAAGISSRASAFCPVSAAGISAQRSSSSSLPSQPANQNHMRCGQPAAAGVLANALNTSGDEGLRAAGCSSHRCPACGRELSTRSNLNKHLRSIHGSMLSERA